MNHLIKQLKEECLGKAKFEIKENKLFAYVCGIDIEYRLNDLETCYSFIVFDVNRWLKWLR